MILSDKSQKFRLLTLSVTKLQEVEYGLNGFEKRGYGYVFA